MSYIRSYNHEHFANEYKIHEISLILKEYRRVAKIILNLQIKSLFQTGKN